MCKDFFHAKHILWEKEHDDDDDECYNCTNIGSDTVVFKKIFHVSENKILKKITLHIVLHKSSQFPRKYMGHIKHEYNP